VTIKVAEICAGSASILPTGKSSGIAKSAITGPVKIGPRGIDFDEQVDRKHHGYPPMALHHFPQEHYAWLRHHFGELTRLGAPGSMGENLSTTGLTEHDVFIGDRFRLGSALIEVTQPRQPCATIEQNLGAKGIVKRMVAAGRSGWFYRVIETGVACKGDVLELVESNQRSWSVARAFLATYGGARGPNAELNELASLPRVSERLVHDIKKRLNRS